MTKADGAIELEGMVSALTVLRVTTPDLTALQQALKEGPPGSDELLQEALLVVDLTAIDGHPDELQAQAKDGQLPPLCPLTLDAIVTTLRELGLSPVAARNLRTERSEEAKRLGLAQVRGSSVRRRRPKKPRASDPAQSGKAPATPDPSAAPDDLANPETDRGQEVAQALDPGLQSPTVTLRQPVRGGQVTYAKGADALCLAAVNPGGELIADGNIHVYGPLRGRALAGAHGDTEARIFCTQLEAELVSIAGVYLQAEDLPEDVRGGPAHIYLEDEKLVVARL